MGPSTSEQRRAITVAVVGTVLVWAYAVFALVQILWLNPHAAVPGSSLEQIRQDMSAANESMSTPLVIGVMGVGPVVAVWVLVRFVLSARLAPAVVLTTYLSMLALGPIAYFWGSFGPGMALADTYAITGGDASPWARPLYVVSAVSLLMLIGVTAGRRVHRSHPSASM